MIDCEEIIKGLTLEDMVGQLLCYDITEKKDPVEIEKMLAKTKPGGIYVDSLAPDKIAIYADMVNRYAKLPVITARDMEQGPELAAAGKGTFPHAMAWGAAGDSALVEKAGRATARIARKNGVHWTFAPVVDLNLNFRSPETSTRAVSDDPDKVIEMAGAFMRGLQEENLLAASCKHFPGQGTDERNSHFCTTINHMTREEWMNTYGRVYKAMIAAGAASIMVAHGCLPAFEDEADDSLGSLPCSLSHNLMTGLLKETLGFEGCVVSDAMSMVGMAACVSDCSRLAVDFIRAGGDMILFPEPTDFDCILAAVKSGEISRERLVDAVTRVIKLKDRVRLFEDQKAIADSIPDVGDTNEIARELAEKSITVVRDFDGILPANLPEGGRILFLNMYEPNSFARLTGDEFDVMKDEFEKYGYKVDVLKNPGHKQVKAVMNDYDLMLLNCNFAPNNYHGGTMRIGWNHIMVMWRAYALRHPRFVCVSFGDPYKLFDMPYLREYINAYSPCAASQRAVANVILGKVPARGTNPVDFPPFFRRGESFAKK